MKSKITITFGFLAIFMVLASLGVPAGLGSPTPARAAPGIVDWNTVDTPGYFFYRNDILSPSEINTLAVGPNGSSMLATVTRITVPPIQLYSTGDSGRAWGGAGLAKAMIQEWGAARNVWDAAIAPDDPRFWAAVTSPPPPALDAPKEVWVTEDAGVSWKPTGLAPLLAAGENVRTIDISPKYADEHDIAVGTVTGGGAGRIFVIKSTGFGSWFDQITGTPFAAAVPSRDFFAVKFSPTYAGDSSLAVVFADATATYYNIAQRDLDQNTTLSWAFTTPGIEVRDPTWTAGDSPGLNQLNRVDLELPSDFSGQAASLRRAYISLDAYASGGAKTNAKDGIFRIDDATQYTLMDTSQDATTSIYSIAYFGTYASGKLLAGERRGYPCTATVPTWFTDSPTTCPIPCWYPALKPTTGAAGADTQGCAAGSKAGTGAAIVAWGGYGLLNGTLAYAATGSLAVATGDGWYSPWLAAPIPNDESAFAISRNNGETWNQISLIDTKITKFTDVAPTPDCKTIYLASVNTNPACQGFDSVWRSSSNADVVSPLPALAGEYWERVLTKITGDDCTGSQTDVALLRIVPYCADPTGEIVAWGVYDTAKKFSNKGIAAWSPDYGDYWANITVRDPIQDFTFESRTVLYFLNPDGGVQKMPYTGTAWATTQSSVDSIIYGAHTIAAYPEGKVIVGAATGYHQGLYATSSSFNFNTDNPSFTVQSLAGRTQYYGDVHVVFDPNFKDNSTYFANDENTGLHKGSVYRNNPAAQVRWEDADMMSNLNGAVGCPALTQLEQTGIVLAFTGQALYSSDAGVASTGGTGDQPLLLDAVIAGGSCNVTATATIAAGTSTTIVWTNVSSNGLIAPDGAPKSGCDITAVSVTSTGAMPGAGSYAYIKGQTNDYFYTGQIDLHTNVWVDGGSTCSTGAVAASSGVWRTIAADADGNWGPLSGMPKPGIAWDRLIVGLDRAPAAVRFTLQPTALKACGCCTLDTNTTLYAIDNANYSVDTRAGMLWGFTDCMAKKGPALITEDKALIGCDPVSGRAQEVNLCWEQLCVANGYDIEIAKANDFAIKVIDWVTEDDCNPLNFLEPADVTKPCVFFPAGGAAHTGEGSAIAAAGNLECGHTYYWRVKTRRGATGQIIRSPWSEIRSFTVKAGLPVVSPYLGLQLLAPNNGCLGCPAKPVSFSWSPLKETSKYKFVLASDAAMTQVVKEAEVTTTAYEYDGTLDYSTSYFWRVMALEPAPSDWSATFSFQTQAVPPPPALEAPPTRLQDWLTLPAKAIGKWIATINFHRVPVAPLLPWAWVLIALGVVLFITWIVVMVAISKVVPKSRK
jgi:hypothetical protein